MDGADIRRQYTPIPAIGNPLKDAITAQTKSRLAISTELPASGGELTSLFRAPTTKDQCLDSLDRLKLFLATAPSLWSDKAPPSVHDTMHTHELSAAGCMAPSLNG